MFHLIVISDIIDKVITHLHNCTGVGIMPYF